MEKIKKSQEYLFSFFKKSSSGRRYVIKRNIELPIMLIWN
jgi:hypothetical protein